MPKPNCTEKIDVGTLDFGRLGRRVVEGRFDGGSMSGDGGVMLLGQVDRKLGLMDAAARCIADPRSPLLITHGVRDMLRQHAVSLSTVMQVCRLLESEGLLEARPRSGYFVRPLQAARLAPVNDPPMQRAPDAAQYVGIHAKVSEFLALGRLQRFKTNLSVARCAPELYPAEALQQAALRRLRQHPDQLVRAAPPQGCLEFREVLAQRAVGAGMRLSASDIQVTNGCTEALNLALRAVANPGDTIAVESPTFYGLLQTLESLGLKALEIPTSPRTGISVDAAELAARATPGVQGVAAVPYPQDATRRIAPNAPQPGL